MGHAVRLPRLGLHGMGPRPGPIGGVPQRLRHGLRPTAVTGAEHQSLNPPKPPPHVQRPVMFRLQPGGGGPSQQKKLAVSGL